MRRIEYKKTYSSKKKESRKYGSKDVRNDESTETRRSIDDKCHRFLNAVEPETEVPIHRHRTKVETFVILRGKVKVSTYDDEGNVKEEVILCPEDGKYGVDIKKNVWHSLESLESGSVIFECKEGRLCPERGLMISYLSYIGPTHR